jgi:hypothetical protein
MLIKHVICRNIVVQLDYRLNEQLQSIAPKLMFQRYAPNEFHADYLSYRLISAKRRWDKWSFYVVSAFFAVSWIALFVRREEVNDFMNRFAETFVQKVFSGSNTAQVITGFALLVFFLNVLPTLIYYARKYWLYPKSSMHLQAYLPVQRKETVKLPRARNATKSPRAYYVYVGHPLSGVVVPVDVSEEWYMHLEAGNQVHAYYHPSNDYVLYLVKHQ